MVVTPFFIGPFHRFFRDFSYFRQSLSVFRQLKRGLGRHLLWFMYSDGICLLDPDYANVWHKRILTKELDKRIDTIVQAYINTLKDHH
jgi:hypothetical protein